MEKRSGVFSHLGGIIRIIILIASIAVITFFVVRFFRNREAAKTAQDSTHVAQTEKQSSEKNQKNSEDSKNNPNDDNSGDVVIPSGVAEGDDSDETNTVPAAGMGSNVVGLTVLVSSTTYAVVFVKDKHRKTTAA